MEDNFLNQEGVIDEARREWYNLNEYTQSMYDAFNNTKEGKDLKAIGVDVIHQEAFSRSTDRFPFASAEPGYQHTFGIT